MAWSEVPVSGSARGCVDLGFGHRDVEWAVVVAVGTE
jgi:hypothetical protein